MDIWNQILLESSRDFAVSAELAWTYHDGQFQSYSKLIDLDSASYSALLLPNDIACDKSIRNFTKYDDSGFTLFVNDNLDPEIASQLRLYWILLVKIKTKKENKPFVLIHASITLDGKISTNSGHSQWIGNKENLVHAHKLRALVDGIMVGANTVRKDSPNLNVRHVKGTDPARLVLSNKTKDFTKLANVENSTTILLRNHSFKDNLTSYPFTEKVYFEDSAEMSELDDLLQKLYKLDISSILIEGGGQTISSFIQSGLIDIIQLNIAPLIFGSGKGFVNLPEIDFVSQGLRLDSCLFYPMGDSILISGSI